MNKGLCFSYGTAFVFREAASKIASKTEGIQKTKVIPILGLVLS